MVTAGTTETAERASWSLLEPQRLQSVHHGHCWNHRDCKACIMVTAGTTETAERVSWSLLEPQRLQSVHHGHWWNHRDRRACIMVTDGTTWTAAGVVESLSCLNVFRVTHNSLQSFGTRLSVTLIPSQTGLCCSLV